MIMLKYDIIKLNKIYKNNKTAYFSCRSFWSRSSLQKYLSLRFAICFVARILSDIFAATILLSDLNDVNVVGFAICYGFSPFLSYQNII